MEDIWQIGTKASLGPGQSCCSGRAPAFTNQIPTSIKPRCRHPLSDSCSAWIKLGSLTSLPESLQLLETRLLACPHCAELLSVSTTNTAKQGQSPEFLRPQLNVGSKHCLVWDGHGYSPSQEELWKSPGISKCWEYKCSYLTKFSCKIPLAVQL